MLKNNSHVDLEEIENLTIGHYEDNAESFRIGTKDHDVSQNIAAFLGALPKGKQLDILDFGCGPGRDLNVFKQSLLTNQLKRFYQVRFKILNKYYYT